MRFGRSISLVSVSCLVGLLASACGDDAAGGAGSGGGEASSGDPTSGTSASGAAVTSSSGSGATSGSGGEGGAPDPTSSSSGDATGGSDAQSSAGSGGAGGEGGGGGGGGGGGSDPGCPEGYAGADCLECAAGYQDDDANGTCLLGCDADGELALDCSDFGACVVPSETGERACACDEGHEGDDCTTCAPGWVQDAPGEPCALDLPSTSMLKLWLDADSPGFGLGENGRVATWEDRRGQVVASVSAPSVQARPLYVGGALGGRPVVRFEGDDVLRASLRVMEGADYTVLAVVEATTEEGNVVSRDHVQFSLGARLRRSGTSFTLLHEAPNGDEDTVSVSGVGSVARVVAAVRQTTPLLELLRVTVRADGDPLAFDAFTPAVAGNLGNMGGRFGVGDGLVGDVAELLVYDRALELDEIERVQRYFVAKYDLE